LRLRGRGQFEVDGKVSEEGQYLRLSHIPRVAELVEADEAPHPCEVGLLGTAAEVTDARPGSPSPLWVESGYRSASQRCRLRLRTLPSSRIPGLPAEVQYLLGHDT
jgi:hypothetical protein